MALKHAFVPGAKKVRGRKLGGGGIRSGVMLGMGAYQKSTGSRKRKMR